MSEVEIMLGQLSGQMTGLTNAIKDLKTDIKEDLAEQSKEIGGLREEYRITANKVLLIDDRCSGHQERTATLEKKVRNGNGSPAGPSKKQVGGLTALGAGMGVGLIEGIRALFGFFHK